MKTYSDRQKADLQRLLDKRLGPNKTQDALRDIAQGREPRVDPVTRTMIRNL
jgi:hypothetical protein